MSKRLREMRLSRARARAAKCADPDPPFVAVYLRPAPAPDPAETFAKKVHDLDVLQKSVEDAASVSSGIWLSYLFTLFYIGIAASAFTHKDLLLENPVKLPFLGVELPLVALFFLAPILFIVSHAYTLVHFAMLAEKVGAYDTELCVQIGGAPETAGLRRQLPSNIFVQLLAGPKDRLKRLWWLLQGIARISLVIGPILLLLLIQVQFLPYHHELVTWLHRLAVVADGVLLFGLWHLVLKSSRGKSVSDSPHWWRRAVAIGLILVSIGLPSRQRPFRANGWMSMSAIGSGFRQMVSRPGSVQRIGKIRACQKTNESSLGLVAVW